MTSSKRIIMWLRLYCRCDHVTKVCYLYQFSERSYHHNLYFIRIWPEKPLFWVVVLVQGQLFQTGTRNGLKALCQCSKRIETKSQKALGVNIYFWRSYRGKTARWGLFANSPPILNTFNLKLKVWKYIYICATWKFKNVNLHSQWHNGFYFIVI